MSLSHQLDRDALLAQALQQQYNREIGVSGALAQRAANLALKVWNQAHEVTTLGARTERESPSRSSRRARRSRRRTRPSSGGSGGSGGTGSSGGSITGGGGRVTVEVEAGSEEIRSILGILVRCRCV